jgi:hypothetical protein
MTVTSFFFLLLTFPSSYLFKLCHEHGRFSEKIRRIDDFGIIFGETRMRMGVLRTPVNRHPARAVPHELLFFPLAGIDQIDEVVAGVRFPPLADIGRPLL